MYLYDLEYKHTYIYVHMCRICVHIFHAYIHLSCIPDSRSYQRPWASKRNAAKAGAWGCLFLQAYNKLPHIYVDAYIYEYIHVYTCMCACVCTYVYIYMHKALGPYPSRPIIWNPHPSVLGWAKNQNVESLCLCGLPAPVLYYSILYYTVLYYTILY